MGSAIHAGIGFVLIMYHYNNYSDAYDYRPDLENFMYNWRESQLVELEDLDEFYSMVSTAQQVIERTIQYLDIPNQWRTVEIEGIPLIEYRGEVPLNDEDMFVFQVDWVATNLMTGMTYLIDWKTRMTFQRDENDDLNSGEDYNIQMSWYEQALQLLGINVVGSITYQILPEVPKTPETTLSGRVSKSLIRTDLATYVNAIRNNGELPTDTYYADVIERLTKQGTSVWWKPVTIYRSAYELQLRWKVLLSWLDRMKADTVYPKVINSMCQFCPFNLICLAEDRGLSIDTVIESEYTTKN